jgi:hypothetical protein
MNSTVVEQGTIRNIIRGIDTIPLEASLFEPIDNAEHTCSTKVFIDINPHNKSVLIGYEHAASEEQLNGMIRWNSVQKEHSGNGIATAGTGHVYYEYLFRGTHYHHSIATNEDGSVTYMESRADTAAIYDAARNTTISEVEFMQINGKSTYFVQKNDEVVETVGRIYANADGKYPFAPKTIFWAKNIKNKELLESLVNEDTIKKLRRELANKYYHEIKSGSLELYIKFPSASEFTTICITDNADTIGLTIRENVFTTDIYEVSREVDGLMKGTMLTKVVDTFFIHKKNGSSTLCNTVTVTESMLPHLLHLYQLIQYTIPDEHVETIKKINMVGASMEAYSGIYLMIGAKLINSKPMVSTLVTRNLPKSRQYRAVLCTIKENITNIKLNMKINSLKADGNLSHMGELESIVKQHTNMYKKYYTTDIVDKDVSPERYLCVKSTNDKTKEKDKKGRLYIIQVGPYFYKVGITSSKKQADYLFNYDAKDRTDFPEETIWPTEKWNYYFLTSYEISNANSLEQQVKEYLLSDQMIETYDAKKGDTIREYFHCENDEGLLNIRRFILEHIAI